MKKNVSIQSVASEADTVSTQLDVQKNCDLQGPTAESWTDPFPLADMIGRMQSFCIANIKMH